MITPAHILISIAGLTRGDSSSSSEAGDSPSYLWPAGIGAVLPDAPMFVFYAVEKLLLGSSESEIWRDRYFQSGWQAFFDAFNSIPICLLLIWIAWRLGSTGWVILFASMLVHCLCDLPLHHDDGHRHFWPMLNWRYASPVSYWDPRHHGIWGAIGEATVAAICFSIAIRRHRSLVRRVTIGLIGACYAALSVAYFSMVLRGFDFQ